jgi:hypothetical protein
MRLYVHTALLIILSGTLASCATQSITARGPVDPSTAATISADSALNFLPPVVVVMKEVDGVPVQSSVSKVTVSPGHHKLAVTCQWLNGPVAYPQTLELDAAPHGRYQLGVKVSRSGGPCEAVVGGALAVPAVHDVNARRLPLLHSFYQDDESCSEHIGEATKQVTWNGRTWYLTAPESLVSPPSETKRNGTPLDVKPLSEFISQAQLRRATLVSGDPTTAPSFAVRLRLVMVVHEILASEPAAFSLQTEIAVRLCDAAGKSSGGALYIGPWKGVNLIEWWRSRKSQRWIDGYREAFSLSVADALEWAAANATTLSAIERLHSGSSTSGLASNNRWRGP